ncbi:MAG: SusC/RagA family TonB-linked outer membrane protein [Bacteroidota bacterium]|nr:SusC/RagA family TonB-linked outer membrane protein [Bacteroidota bacterium]
MNRKIGSLLVLLLLIGPQLLQAQGTRFIKGKVYELYNGKREPIPGVNVVFSNSQNRMLTGTTTNVMGEYSLKVPAVGGNIKLVFSFIGKRPKTYTYTGQTNLDVVLESNEVELGDVVVTKERMEKSSLGITTREQTFASQRIKMDDVLEGVPVTSVEEALQGHMAGVDIIASGDPGAKSSIRIRGTATLNSNADPLIVINGVPYSTNIDDSFDFATANNEDYADMLNINPYDIESIEVLKDAASTAIYGTKGANGVLLITTKKGNKGKTRFTFSDKETSKIEPDAIPMLDGNEYVAFIQDAIWNTANAQGLAKSAALLKLLFDTPEINYNKGWRYFDEYNSNTDWLSYVKKDAFITDNSFSMSGGGDKATYRFSLSYLNEGGTTVGTGLSRLTSSLNIGYHFSDKLRVDANFSYSDSYKKDNWTSTVRAEALRKMPNKSPYWIDDATGLPTSTYFTRQNSEEFQGAFTGSANYHPIIMATESYNNLRQREENMTFDMNYDVMPGLIYSGYVSMKLNTGNTKMFLPQSATDVTIDNTYANRSTDAFSNNLALQTENKMIFRKNWEETHNLVATALWRTSQSVSSSYSSEIYGAATAGMSDPVAGGCIRSLGSGKSEVRILSGIGSVNYTFLNRYIMNGTANYEGRSSLGTANRWGLFPSAGLAWLANEEPFLKEVPWIEQLKIRSSIGQSGQAPSGTAPYVGTYSSLGEYISNAAVAPSSMQLNKLKWESSTEYDAGADIGLWGNKLSMTFDYYYKYTTNLLQSKVSIPSSTGYDDEGNTVSYYNSGELSNKGWEYRIDYEVLKKKNLRITTNFNINRNVNKIEKIPDNLAVSSYSLSNGTYAQKIEAGRPVGSFYGFQYAGVYQNTEDTYARDGEGNVMTNLSGNPIVMKNGTYTCYPGDAKYKDINHDGVINEKDIVYIGNSMPMVTGGGGFNIKYKNLSLMTFFHYRLGQKIINEARMNSESMYGTDNQSKAVLRRWRNEGDDTDIPRALWKYGLNWLGSDRFVEDCSFLRLKTISLSYDLPKKTCQRIHANSINLFLTGYDLFTWTNYTGQDPEVNLPGKITDLAVDDAQTPRSHRFSAGITVNF